MGKGLCHLCEHSRVLYLKIEGLNGLPILVVGELAKKCPLLLQVFIKPLKREQDGGKILHLVSAPAPQGGMLSLPVPVLVPSHTSRSAAALAGL